MITGLEIASIVIACVNAGLGAAKLITDWKARRAERGKEARNGELEEALRADALSISSAYTFHYEQLGQDRERRRRFEVGDDMSREEMHPRSERFKTAMRDLVDKLRRSKKDAKVVPGIDDFKSSSSSMHLTVIESLARLHQRIIHSSSIPRSLNPLRLFGFGKKKAEDDDQDGSESARKLGKIQKGTASVKTIEPLVKSASAITLSPKLPSPPQSPPPVPTQSAGVRPPAGSRSAVSLAWILEAGTNSVNRFTSTDESVGTDNVATETLARSSRPQLPIKTKLKADLPVSDTAKPKRKTKQTGDSSKAKTQTASAGKSTVSKPSATSKSKPKASEAAKSKSKTASPALSTAVQKQMPKNVKTTKTVKLKGKAASKTVKSAA